MSTAGQLSAENKNKPKKKFKAKIKRKAKPVTKAIRKQPPRIFYSVKEVCTVLSLGRTSVFSLLAHNKLASVVHGRRRLVYRQSVKEYAASLFNTKRAA